MGRREKRKERHVTATAVGDGSAPIFTPPPARCDGGQRRPRSAVTRRWREGERRRGEGGARRGGLRGSSLVGCATILTSGVG
eukprot:scaffold202693_cov18-Tisochrysis_lutea.AAC.1